MLFVRVLTNSIFPSSSLCLCFQGMLVRIMASIYVQMTILGGDFSQNSFIAPAGILTEEYFSGKYGCVAFSQIPWHKIICA